MNYEAIEELAEATREMEAIEAIVAEAMKEERKLITPEELAEELIIPVATLYQWRLTNTGPKALKVGRHLRYRRKDIDAWLDRLAEEGK